MTTTTTTTADDNGVGEPVEGEKEREGGKAQQSVLQNAHNEAVHKRVTTLLLSLPLHITVTQCRMKC